MGELPFKRIGSYQNAGVGGSLIGQGQNYADEIGVLLRGSLLLEAEKQGYVSAIGI